MNLFIPSILRSESELFHGSSTSGLKKINVSSNKTKHSDSINRIYASSLINVAAAFSFNWDDSMGILFGQIDDGPLILSMPSKYKKLLHNSCSIYTVDPSHFIMTENHFLEEYQSYTNANVLSEQKFKTVLDAFDFTNLNYVIIK